MQGWLAVLAEICARQESADPYSHKADRLSTSTYALSKLPYEKMANFRFL